MEVIDKNYTECEKCPDGIYKNEDQDGFVYCDRCGHKIRRDGKKIQMSQTYAIDLLSADPVYGVDDFGGFDYE